MAKTNWQDPRTGEIISPHISGLQEAVGKIEESIGMNTISETDIPLTEVFISNDDRYRIFQAPEGKRNWLSSPTPVIKKNGVVITDDFEIDYGGGAIIFTTPLGASAYITADVSYTKEIVGKQLSTNDYSNEEKLKNQNNKDDILNLLETVGDTTMDDTLVPISDTGLSVKILLSWLGNMIKSITGKASWRTKPTKNLEELNTALTTHEADYAKEATVLAISSDDIYKMEGFNYYKKNGIVFLCLGEIQKKDASAFELGEYITRLPVGFRPKQSVYVQGVSQTATVRKPLPLIIYSTGEVQILQASSDTYIRFSTSYYAGGGTV